MKKSIYFLLFIVLWGCDTQTSQEKIDNLNGYWAISEVETANGETKEYPAFNSLVDYIEIDGNNKGFRRKVKPKLDGKYIVIGAVESIQIKVENDSINLYYSTKMDEWKETLISSNENEIVLKNEYGNKYTYKRFTGYLDEQHGEKE